ncbi:beta-1,3-galactosyl-O-glycosyl-glycoprotein beta-1,6-N-acetylglucosaminyltransferase-like [Haliotis rubra]|uniref:beta-1,3-galactosyl-O-glycosyl-glycoprotein beta-1,6-N-acetylglucosaminyltransferase-like n=1 Tax=Haliotis rubra TaxID=36100 RepID=UPI001EE4F530|nr:beta-1,3-galactosyl-O-glycosyl-glycoprotein beta-1,6-N-acetylglucosaminyltransferase-like [Haliotis rubra]
MAMLGEWTEYELDFSSDSWSEDEDNSTERPKPKTKTKHTDTPSVKKTCYQCPSVPQTAFVRVRVQGIHVVNKHKRYDVIDPMVSTGLINKGKLCFLMGVVLCIGFLSLEMYIVHQKNTILMRVTEAKRKDGKYFITIHKRKHGTSVTKTLKLSKPSCSGLFAGDGAAIAASIRYSRLHPHSSKNDYVWAARNCTDFIRNRGYITNSAPEENEFPLAISILMYKDVEQVERLLRTIYRPSNFYCIHMDFKTALKVKNQMISIVKCFPNVFFSSKQVDVTWGRFSVLEAELVCMRDLLKYPGWKYFINLTGQEFPLKTNLEIVRILKIMNGANSVDANTQSRWIRRRWKKAFPTPHGIIPYKGNVHVVVSRGFVDYAINDPIAQNFTEWLKRTKVPDETFFGTLNNNPKLRVPGSSTGRISTDYHLKPYIARFKNWGPIWGEKSFDWPCKGLLSSRRELFANKFHIDYQPQTYDCMDEWIRNRTIQEYNGTFTMNYDFYEKMPHLKYIYRTPTMK